MTKRPRGASLAACRVCGGCGRPAFTKMLLGKHSVQYFVCQGCEFLFTEEPYWLEQAYCDAIATADTGIAMRNVMYHRRLAPTLTWLFGPEACFVDWAGGYGLLVRLMRDYGLDFFWQDAYCDNLFARGFEWSSQPSERSASAVTAIEVLEHVADPVQFVMECLAGARTDTLLFSQILRTDLDPNWWYLAPEFGQHISFFTAKTLACIAERCGMYLVGGRDLFMLTKSRVSERRFSMRLRGYRLLYPLMRRQLTSHTESDHLQLIAAAAPHRRL